jgi:hypothetical protein
MRVAKKIGLLYSTRPHECQQSSGIGGNAALSLGKASGKPHARQVERINRADSAQLAQIAAPAKCRSQQSMHQNQRRSTATLQVTNRAAFNLCPQLLDGRVVRTIEGIGWREILGQGNRLLVARFQSCDIASVASVQGSREL